MITYDIQSKLVARMQSYMEKQQPEHILSRTLRFVFVSIHNFESQQSTCELRF